MSIYESMGVDPGAKLVRKGTGPQKTGRLYIKLHSAQIEAYLKSPEVQALLRAQAEAIEAALPVDSGEEWKVEIKPGRDRAQAAISTDNAAARRSEASDHTLIRAVAGKRRAR